MRKSNATVLIAAVAAFSFLAVACSNVSSGTSAPGSGGAVPDNSGTTINIAISPWLGSAANVAGTDGGSSTQRHSTPPELGSASVAFVKATTCPVKVLLDPTRSPPKLSLDTGATVSTMIGRGRPRDQDSSLLL